MSPQDQDMIKKVVMAGMKIMYDPKTFPILQQGIEKKMPLSDKLATETAGLVKMLKDKAQGSIPKQVILPAATMLLLDLAKFMEKTKAATPTQQDMRAAYVKLIILLGHVFAPPKKAAPAAPTGVPAAPAPAATAPGAPVAPQTGILGGQ